MRSKLTLKPAVDYATGSNAKGRQMANYTQVVDSGCPIRSYFGVAQADTDSSLKAGQRGPSLLEDYHFREKISHFDHERIPERVVHARGAAFHGEFVLHTAIPEYTSAAVLNDTSRRTPVFLRFSTVAGSRGSADTVRDVRGFAVRFYTEEGNWDIVGNNIPVFFIQDAIKFPDVIHAVKPEPHNEIPQAQTAHDNAWDFFSLTPETAHMMLWTMSDRAIPRSYAMMNGFGVHSFILVNAEGKRHFVKFHFKPKLGVHSLVWDEALKLAGQDPDFHRRDMYDAIEDGNYAEWEFGVQVVPEEKEHDFDFDLLDATKLIPEDLVPVKYIGTLTLNRNVSEYFPETEQVAFCTQHIVPGIDFSNDPLLQGRNFSYFDTQISRLGGPNFNQIPINMPLCPVFNNQRDAMHRMTINKGGANYWPNRFDAPHPVPPQKGGFLSEPLPVSGTNIRARGEKFSDYLSQAQLFYNSMSDVEKKHMVFAFSFELGKVDDTGIHERIVVRLNEIDHSLAKQVAVNIGQPVPPNTTKNHGKKSAFLSQIDGKAQSFTPKGRKVGILLYDEFDTAPVLALQTALKAAGTMAMIVGPRKGSVTSGATTLPTQFTFETCRSTHFDAIYVAGGTGEAYTRGLNTGRLIHAVREAYMHQKPIAVSGSAVEWLQRIALPGEVSPAISGEGKVEVEKGVVILEGATESPQFAKTLIDLLAKHRVWERDVGHIAA
ncbi:catalase-domain-containing protein [Calocera viscosa TUFC12733]|uniref:Catalase n=1 Tax=Calocera viscosa (strain TUFC12733) TaxID=1330018 RepID=A0A167RKR5_CALVF|nr:catalase-domain-containing protein [Calocera viscosa TUFC12733]